MSAVEARRNLRAAGSGPSNYISIAKGASVRQCYIVNIDDFAIDSNCDFMSLPLARAV